MKQQSKGRHFIFMKNVSENGLIITIDIHEKIDSFTICEKLNTFPLMINQSLTNIILLFTITIQLTHWNDDQYFPSECFLLILIMMSCTEIFHKFPIANNIIHIFLHWESISNIYLRSPNKTIKLPFGLVYLMKILFVLYWHRRENRRIVCLWLLAIRYLHNKMP